jgi:phosphatidylglycerophosphate synthase
MVKTAIILANDGRCLQPVFGLPAVRRLVLVARRLGIGEVHVVSRQESIFAVNSDLASRDAFHTVHDLKELETVVGKMDLRKGGRVLVVRADHVVDGKSLSAFIYASDSDADRDAIYALRPDGRARAEAIYVAGGDALLPVLRAVWSPGESDLSILDKAKQLEICPGLPFIVGGDDDMAGAAEDRLAAALPSATANRDGFMARHVDRHFSRLISRRLACTSVTPNGITLFNTAIGLAGAFLLSKGAYWSQLVGTLLFLLCVVLDGVDGEVARLKLQETAFGHYLDLVTDNIVHAAIFVGLAVGLYRESGNGIYLHLLWLLLGGFVLCAASVYRVSSAGRVKAESTAAERLTGLLANRDFAYLLVALAIVGHLNWFLVGAAVGSYLFAAAVLALDFKRRSSAHA